MKRTGPCGQACGCVCADAAVAARVVISAMTGTQSLDIFEVLVGTKSRR
jgi:hypothetical protein